MFDKLKNGYVAEEKFALECLTRNIPISRPIYNTEPYDFIIEVDGKFVSVQVKKSWKDKKGEQCSVFEIVLSSFEHKKNSWRKEKCRLFGCSC